jgi:DNA-binding NtrC family response regulator
MPFVHICAADLPLEPDVLHKYCNRVRAAAGGGSIFISAVEELPLGVQDASIELLAGSQRGHHTSVGVRLISGTTVPLLDRVAAGTFSKQLFYRLNVIHLSLREQ